MTSIDRGHDVRGHLRVFLRNNFLYLSPQRELHDDEDLLARGLVDSLGVVELVERVQHQFHVHVDDDEITRANFGSVDGMVRFVTEKRAR